MCSSISVLLSFFDSMSLTSTWYLSLLALYLSFLRYSHKYTLDHLCRNLCRLPAVDVNKNVTVWLRGRTEQQVGQSIGATVQLQTQFLHQFRVFLAKRNHVFDIPPGRPLDHKMCISLIKASSKVGPLML